MTRPCLLALSATCAAFMLVPAHAATQQGGRATEQEPNSSLGTANRVSLGDTVTGVIAVDGDDDYFVVDVPGGTTLHLVRTVAAGDATLPMCLYDLDGVTILNCKSDVIEQPFSYPITVSGRYAVRVQRSHASAGYVGIGPYTFELRGDPFALGPGDPIAPLVNPLFENIWSPYRIAAGLNGELYVVVPYGGRVLRIDNNGQISTIASGLDLTATGGAAIDGFGNLLVTGSDGGILRISPTGEVVPLTAPLGDASWYEGLKIAVGPDGDIWAGLVNRLWRFDPTGKLKAEIPVPGCQFSAFAVSPAGDLHFATGTSGCDGIYRITASGPQRVIRDFAGELAFDRDGNLYVGAWDRYYSDSGDTWGNVVVYDAEYRTVQRIASVPSLSGGLVFARDGQGTMTSRLLTVQYGFWSQGLRRIVELNGAAMRQPGSGMRERFYRADLGQRRPGVLASAYADTLRVVNASGSVVWSIDNGTLPPGISLSATGVLHGTPVDTGSFTFTARGATESQVWYGTAAIRVAPAEVSVAEVTNALLGGGTLSPALVEFLDRHGNNNGILDVGDFRAYLRAQGRLP